MGCKESDTTEHVCVAAYFLEIIFSFFEEKEMCLLCEGIFNFIFILLNVL